MHWSVGGSSAWFVMTIAMLVFWALAIFLIRPRFRNPRRSSSGSTSPPEEVLARRFAAGDIDEQEYRTRLEALRSVTLN